MKALSEEIRQRAFEIFERRDGHDGVAIDDWLKAERDLLRNPESELVEQEGKCEVRVSTPGFDPGDVHVTALADALIVQASSAHNHDKSEGSVRFCEFSQKTLFRRFNLPESHQSRKSSGRSREGSIASDCAQSEASDYKEAEANCRVSIRCGIAAGYRR